MAQTGILVIHRNMPLTHGDFGMLKIIALCLPLIAFPFMSYADEGELTRSLRKSLTSYSDVKVHIVKKIGPSRNGQTEVRLSLFFSPSYTYAKAISNAYTEIAYGGINVSPRVARQVEKENHSLIQRAKSRGERLPVTFGAIYHALPFNDMDFENVVQADPDAYARYCFEEKVNLNNLRLTRITASYSQLAFDYTCSLLSKMPAVELSLFGVTQDVYLRYDTMPKKEVSFFVPSALARQMDLDKDLEIFPYFAPAM